MTTSGSGGTRLFYAMTFVVGMLGGMAAAAFAWPV
jgi:hypothetical protein